MGVLQALLPGAQSRRHARAALARARRWKRTAFPRAAVAPQYYGQARHLPFANAASARLDRRQYFSRARASLADEHFHCCCARRLRGTDPARGTETREISMANDYLDCRR